MELKAALAEILLRYDVELAAGYDQQCFLDHQQDTFVATPPALPLMFKERGGVDSA